MDLRRIMIVMERYFRIPYTNKTKRMENLKVIMKMEVYLKKEITLKVKKLVNGLNTTQMEF